MEFLSGGAAKGKAAGAFDGVMKRLEDARRFQSRQREMRCEFALLAREAQRRERRIDFIG